MKNSVNAILIHEDDNVVTVLNAVEQGGVVAFQRGNSVVKLKIIEDIPVFHKVSIADIARDETVYKYEQVIGKAIVNINE